MQKYRKQSGFTLAELLVTLVVLAVVAVFAVPKLFNHSEHYLGITKDSILQVSQAYQIYTAENDPTANTGTMDITRRLDSLGRDQTSIVDLMPNHPSGDTTRNCGLPPTYCVKLKNGAMLNFDFNGRFGGTTSSNAIWFDVDPDGRDSNVEATGFFLYFDGSVRTHGGCLPSTEFSGSGGLASYDPDSSRDPTWFHW